MSLDLSRLTSSGSDQKPSADHQHDWWRRPFSVFQTNLQEIDATLDVERALDFIEDHGADTWLINTGGIASFYPTELPFQTRGPFLANRPSGDLIGDAVHAAHQRGVRVISRLDLSKVASPIAHRHQDWLYVSPAGKSQVYNTLYSTCPSRAYYQDRSLEILDEIIDRYPVDGFFFNWFGFSERDYSRVYHGVCHCPECADGFAAFTGGKSLPAGPGDETYPDWLRFSTETIVRLTSKIRRHVEDRRPDAALVLGDGAAVIYHEANNAFGRDFWPQATAESCSAHAAGGAEQSMIVNSVSFLDMPYRLAGEQPERFEQYLLQAISRGARPSTYIMGAPGRIPYANLLSSRAITRFYRDNHPVYETWRPAANVALVQPDGLRSSDPDNQDPAHEFRGLYSALQESHLLFDVVPVERLRVMQESDGLGEYAVVIVPGLGELGPETAAALDQYAAAGGNLVLTGNSGVRVDGSVEIGAAPALMRLGDPLSGQQLWSTYVTPSEQPVLDKYAYRPAVLPVFGSYHRYVWRPEMAKVGRVLSQAPYGPPEKAYGHTAGNDPAYAIAHTGPGSVTMVPWTVGLSYYEFGTAEIRDHFISIIKPLAPQTITADVPEQVDVSLGASAGRYVVHLINQTGLRRRTFGPPVPVSGGVLRIHNVKAPIEVHALVSGAPVGVVRDGNDSVLQLPILDLFEVLTISTGVAADGGCDVGNGD